MEIPQLEHQDGLEFIYFYTDGKIGGNHAIKSLLTYLRQSIIDNVTDDATETSITNIMESLDVTFERACEILRVNAEDFASLREKLQKHLWRLLNLKKADISSASLSKICYISLVQVNDVDF